MPFSPQAVICITAKNSSHKSHQIFHETLSVYHLANVIGDTNITTEYISVSIDVNDVEDLAPTFPDLEQRLQVNRAELYPLQGSAIKDVVLLRRSVSFKIQS